ncbi:hypothetical protein SDC9_137080 [bioreactor metagenome]|uniref:Antitoxin SocA-like Panacea domain-containing protein n=1 Tax=bioreactor metagenome TaxID=1076179 RepID=A0A645DL11_9ZZZZ
MNSYSVLEVANWFLSKESMTPKKLQKLVYYFVAWSYALFNENLVNDTEFEAWVHGPVSPELYKEYKGYGWRDIDQCKDNSSIFDGKTQDLLESIWITYGDKSANELEALTHQEDPWRRARAGLDTYDSSNEKISPEVMREYYGSIYIGD